MSPSRIRSLVVAFASAAVVLCSAAPVRAQASAPAPLRSTVFPSDSARSRKTGAVSQRSIVDTLTARLNKLEMHETTIPPGAMPHPAHKHLNEELIVVRSGTIEVLLDGKTLTARTGDIAYMASNEMHGFRNVGPGPATYLVIRMDAPDQPGDPKP